MLPLFISVLNLFIYPDLLHLSLSIISMFPLCPSISSLICLMLHHIDMYIHKHALNTSNREIKYTALAEKGCKQRNCLRSAKSREAVSGNCLRQRCVRGKGNLYSCPFHLNPFQVAPLFARTCICIRRLSDVGQRGDFSEQWQFNRLPAGL